MKLRRKRIKRGFGARADMYIARAQAPLNAHTWSDNSMRRTDFSEFDSPTYLRLKRKVNLEPVAELPVFRKTG